MQTITARLNRKRDRIVCGARGRDDILCWVSTWERVGGVIIIRTPLLNAGPGPVEVQTLDFPTRDWKLLIRRTEHEPWHEMEPGEAAHRIVFRRGWAPDADGIWAMAKRARRNLDAGRAPRVRRGWVQFLGSEKLQQGEVLRPAAARGR